MTTCPTQSKWRHRNTFEHDVRDSTVLFEKFKNLIVKGRLMGPAVENLAQCVVCAGSMVGQQLCRRVMPQSSRQRRATIRKRHLQVRLVFHEETDNFIMPRGSRCMQGGDPPSGPLLLRISIQIGACLEQSLHFCQIPSCSRLGKVPLLVPATCCDHQDQTGHEDATRCLGDSDRIDVGHFHRVISNQGSI